MLGEVICIFCVHTV